MHFIVFELFSPVTVRVVAHCDQSADTELKVDASPVGLGAILLQSSTYTVHPLASYASCMLTDVEQ